MVSRWTILVRGGETKLALLKKLHARTWHVAERLNPNPAPDEVQALAYSIFQSTRAECVTIDADMSTATMRATTSPKLDQVDVAAASNCARGIMPLGIDWAIE